MSDASVSFGLKVSRVRDGDTLTASLSEIVVSYLIGFKGGTEEKTSLGEGVRFLGVWCPEKKDPGGPEAAAFTHHWSVMHDHPKQHAYSKTLVAVCSTADLRDSFGRVLALVRCTHCGAVLNEDLVSLKHADVTRPVRMRRDSLLLSDKQEVEQHERALIAIRDAVGSRKFGAHNLLRLMAGQTSFSLPID